MSLPNPYTPGAGFMPTYLAGRDELLQEANQSLQNLANNYPQRSIIYYGLRGVGKTVLLNAVEEKSELYEINFMHIEVMEKSNFLSTLFSSTKRFIAEITPKSKKQNFINSAKALLSSLTVTYELGDQKIKLDIDPNTTSLATGSLANDLTQLFIVLGKLLKNSNSSLCIFVDEIQYMRDEEIESLVNALHRCNQLRLPIMIFGAGLPKILKTVGEAKSYSERLFEFKKVDKLQNEDAKKAIIAPANIFGVSYTDSAIEKIIEITSGYPYFIQEFCNIIWDSSNKYSIDIDIVEKCICKFTEKLDDGFFRIRYERCSNKEKEFMFAMIKCEGLPCTVSNVATMMKSSVKTISVHRAQLIHKGMIYATGYGEIDFTVPQFDKFLYRMLNKKN